MTFRRWFLQILHNIALRDGAASEFKDVIIDEFHYYSDRVWHPPCTGCALRGGERRLHRSSSSSGGNRNTNLSTYSTAATIKASHTTATTTARPPATLQFHLQQQYKQQPHLVLTPPQPSQQH